MSQIKTKQLLVNVPNNRSVNSSSNGISTPVTPSNNIYGELSEKVIRPVYTSIDTETLDITLDNQNMTIKGDVKWTAFTGETPDKAYPGNLGNRNYELIQILRKEFDKLLERYENFVLNANYVLDYMPKKMEVFTETIQRGFDDLYQHVDTSIAEFANKIVSLNRTDKILFRTIKKETENRIIACEEIHSIIKNETAHRVAAVNKIHEKLDAEIARAIETDSKLENVQLRHTAELEALRVRLDSLKEELNNKILQNVSDLNDRITKVEELIRQDLVEQVSRLDNKIDDEISRATEAEKSVLLQAKQYTDQVKQSILGEGLTEAFDTLVEVENWIKTQGIKIKDIFLAITKETDARKTEDKLLWSAIHSEIERAETAESLETLARIKGDTLLQTALTKEIESLQTVDSNLNAAITRNQDAIQQEIARATLQETLIGSDVNTLKNFISGLEIIDGGTSSQFRDLV